MADQNLTEFNKGKSKDLPLEVNNPRHQRVVEATQKENSFARRGLGVLAGTKLNVSQQCDLATRVSSSNLSYIRKSYQQFKEGALCPLLSEWWETFGILHLNSVLGSPLQERDEDILVSPVKSHKG